MYGPRKLLTHISFIQSMTPSLLVYLPFSGREDASQCVQAGSSRSLLYAAVWSCECCICITPCNLAPFCIQALPFFKPRSQINLWRRVSVTNVHLILGTFFTMINRSALFVQTWQVTCHTFRCSDWLSVYPIKNIIFMFSYGHILGNMYYTDTNKDRCRYDSQILSR